MEVPYRPRGIGEPLKIPAELAGIPQTEMTVYYVAVYWALRELKRAFTPQINYEGGAGYPGGTRVDFRLDDAPQDLYVNGPYWHETAESRARDRLNEIALKAQGRTAVIIWWWEVEDDVIGALQRKIGYTLGGT